MPLVIPGMTSKSDDKSMEWQNKLMGKKLGDTSDAITFPKTDLPNQHRVIKPGEMTTTDHVPERMNIHVGDDGTVQKITHG